MAFSTPGLLLRQYDTLRKATYELSQGQGAAKEDRLIDGALSPGVFTELVSQGASWDSQSFTPEQLAEGWQGIQVTLVHEESTDCFFLTGGVVEAPSPGPAAIVFQNPENHVLVSSERILVPVGDQVGNGNLFLTIPTEPANLLG